MPKAKVTASRGRGAGTANCESCDFYGPKTRERVRLHVLDNGHVVHFVIRDITTYYPPEADRG